MTAEGEEWAGKLWRGDSPTCRVVVRVSGPAFVSHPSCWVSFWWCPCHWVAQSPAHNSFIHSPVSNPINSLVHQGDLDSVITLVCLFPVWGENTLLLHNNTVTQHWHSPLDRITCWLVILIQTYKRQASSLAWHSPCGRSCPWWWGSSGSTGICFISDFQDGCTSRLVCVGDCCYSVIIKSYDLWKRDINEFF